jgi:hypothetical protein
MGALYSHRRQLQTAADAAALAGVQSLPSNPARAVALAAEYAARNTAQADETAFTVTSTYASNDTITAMVRDSGMELFFARFLDSRRDSAAVGASAKASVVSPSAYGSGVMPLGIMSKEPSGTAAFGYVFNEPLTMKWSSEAGESGNFQFLDIIDAKSARYWETGGGGGGSNDVYDALAAGGVSNPVYISAERLPLTETGINGTKVPQALNTMVGGDAHSFDQVASLNPETGLAHIKDPSCPRILVCPIIVDPGPPIAYSWEAIKGSKKVRIIAFAYFYLEDWGSGGGKECWVKGRFIRPVTPDDPVLQWGPVDPYGALAFRLVD